jgi:hypothetical protein
MYDVHCELSDILALDLQGNYVVDEYMKSSLHSECFASQRQVWSGDKRELVNFPSCESTKLRGSGITYSSFGFSSEHICAVIRSVPRTLNQELQLIVMAQETILGSFSNSHDRDTGFAIELAPIDSIFSEIEQKHLMEHIGHNGYGVLRISVDQDLFINSTLMDMWGLDKATVPTHTFSFSAAFPFDTIDYLSILVHDVENASKDDNIRYCRVLSPHSKPWGALLVYMLTRKRQNSRGELIQVRELKNSSTSNG